MHSEFARQSESNQRASIGELFSQLAADSAALVRDEIDLAKQEMREKLRSFRTGLIMIVVGVLVGQIAVFLLAGAGVLGLAIHVGPAVSALLIGAVLALIAGVTALIGLRQLKRTNLKPEQTIRTLEEGREWLRELT